MVQHIPARRPPWEDRFRQPSFADLRGMFEHDDAALFEEAARTIDEILDESSHVAWRGACWKWTVLWRSQNSDRFEVALIPNPQDLQLAIRLQPAFVAEEISSRKRKRTIRDGIVLASDPFDTEFGIWSISSMAILRDLLRLLEDQQEFQSQRD